MRRHSGAALGLWPVAQAGGRRAAQHPAPFQHGGGAARVAAGKGEKSFRALVAVGVLGCTGCFAKQGLCQRGSGTFRPACPFALLAASVSAAKVAEQGQKLEALRQPGRLLSHRHGRPCPCLQALASIGVGPLPEAERDTCRRHEPLEAAGAGQAQAQ